MLPTNADKTTLACLDRLLVLEPEHKAAYSRQFRIADVACGRRTTRHTERYEHLFSPPMFAGMHLNLPPSPALTALLTEPHTQAGSPVTVTQRRVDIAMEPSIITTELRRTAGLPPTHPPQLRHRPFPTTSSARSVCLWVGRTKWPTSTNG